MHLMRVDCTALCPVLCPVRCTLCAIREARGRRHVLCAESPQSCGAAQPCQPSPHCSDHTALLRRVSGTAGSSGGTRALHASVRLCARACVHACMCVCMRACPAPQLFVYSQSPCEVSQAPTPIRRVAWELRSAARRGAACVRVYMRVPWCPHPVV